MSAASNTLKTLPLAVLESLYGGITAGQPFAMLSQSVSLSLIKMQQNYESGCCNKSREDRHYSAPKIGGERSE